MRISKMLLFCFLILLRSGTSTIYPIQFSISETKIVDAIPEKTRDFAYIIPGQFWSYIYSEEDEYYKGYQNSFFAYTWKKGGWDCMRHYEILANGCIPYFIGLEEADINTMFFLPRELILEAMSLPGVMVAGIDHQLFDREKYDAILLQLLAHTREYLTARAMAGYVLQTIGYKGGGKILFLLGDSSPDYLPCTLLIGLKELIGDQAVDVPKLPYIYTNYSENIKNLYGKGMSYTKIVEDLPLDRTNIERRIQKKEFDFVIYGSVHRGLPYLDLVKNIYSEDEVFYFCGEDSHLCEYKNLPHLFIREFEALK